MSTKLEMAAKFNSVNKIYSSEKNSLTRKIKTQKKTSPKGNLERENSQDQMSNTGANRYLTIDVSQSQE